MFVEFDVMLRAGTGLFHMPGDLKNGCIEAETLRRKQSNDLFHHHHYQQHNNKSLPMVWEFVLISEDVFTGTLAGPLSSNVYSGW